jgi:hypothetical protein
VGAPSRTRAAPLTLPVEAAVVSLRVASILQLPRVAGTRRPRVMSTASADSQVAAIRDGQLLWPMIAAPAETRTRRTSDTAATAAVRFGARTACCRTLVSRRRSRADGGGRRSTGDHLPLVNPSGRHPEHHEVR